MENSYGVGVQNRFGAFFDEEGDPFEMMKKPAVVKSSEEKENKDKSKNAKVATKKIGAKTENTLKTDKNTVQGKPKQQGQRNGDNRVKFSDHEERNNRRNRQEGPRDSTNGHSGPRFDEDRPARRNDNDRPPRRFDDRPPRRFDDDGSRRFNDGGPRRFNDGGEGSMGRGRGRGMGRGRGRGNKREFDRHSGSERSGVKPVDKREGGGSYNWGSARDQLEDMQVNEQANTEAEASEDKDKDKTAATTTEENAEGSDNDSADKDASKEPEEPREMTLDEYKAMQQASRVKPEFNVRKAGEGENQAQWKKTYVLKKKIVESDEEEEEEEDEEEEGHQGKRKLVLDIDFQFSDSPMRGRGRGRGRGMGRGRGSGGGRGMDRGGRGNFGGGGGGSYGGRGSRNLKQEAPRMDDEGDFPSLKLGR